MMCHLKSWTCEQFYIQHIPPKYSPNGRWGLSLLQHNTNFGKNYVFLGFMNLWLETREWKVILVWQFANTYRQITLVQYYEEIFINKYFVALKMKTCQFGMKKSKLTPKIQDGGRIFLCLLTKKLDMALKNTYTKNGACCQSVKGPTVSARNICVPPFHLLTTTVRKLYFSVCRWMLKCLTHIYLSTYGPPLANTLHHFKHSHLRIQLFLKKSS